MVTDLCGADGTDRFKLFHPPGYLALIAGDVVGELRAEQEVTAHPTLHPTPQPIDYVSNYLPTSLVEETTTPVGPETGLPTLEPTTSPTTQTPSGKPIKEEPVVESSISLDELEQHNKASDCWTVYDGIVYDVTSYAPTHPGGKFQGRFSFLSLFGF